MSIGALPGQVDLPTGNVRVVPVRSTSGDVPQSPAVEPVTATDATSVAWMIRDAEGAEIEAVAGPRSAALRRMGVIAFHGASLPLRLYGPDGHPTGDRLPG